MQKNPTMSHGAGFGIYAEKFGMSDRTFDKDWKAAGEDFQAYQREANAAKRAASITEEVIAVQNGLKSKFDRVMILQNEIDKCLAELESDQTEDRAISFGEVITFARRLKPSERVALRKTIKELQSEISKIEGDYAPEQMDITSKTIMIGYSDDED